MSDFIFKIISTHKTGNDYDSLLKLLSLYKETINEKNKGFSLYESFILNDYQKNPFNLPEVKLESKKNESLEEKYSQTIFNNKEKNYLLEYILLNTTDLHISYEIFDKIVRQHYLCTGLALNFIESKEFENQEEPPLHFAVKNNYYKLVNLLISSGYNIFNKDKNGKIALYYIKNIECFNELITLYDFEREDMQSIYKDCIENIFRNTVTKKRPLLDSILNYFSKNKISETIKNTISLLLVTESKDKFLKKYSNIFNKNLDANIMLDNGMFPLSFGSLFFIANPSGLNYKGMLYYKDLKEKETIPGIKDGFLAHLAFFSDNINIHSAFFNPCNDEKHTFMSFFKEQYKEENYHTFIQHLIKAFTFFKINIPLYYNNEKNIIKYHHSISQIFDKHFKVDVSNPLPPFFNGSIKIDDSLLEDFIKLFDLYRESNAYITQYYIKKKESKEKNYTYYGSFKDSGTDKIILSYIIKRYCDSLSSATHFKILEYCFRQCELITQYSLINNRHETKISDLSFVIDSCLNKLDSSHIEKLYLNEERYTQILIDANIKNINIRQVIINNKYNSISDYTSSTIDIISINNSKNRI